MALVVLSYPDISQEDFQWIQSVRAKYDELRYRMVGPHFTIVFPVRGMGRESFCQHVRQQVHDVSKVQFTLKCAVPVKDHFFELTHLFLVPDRGYSDIVELHDKLYTGPLAPELRLDIPFIPHVSTASVVDPLRCKELADTINANGLSIDGVISKLDIAHLKNDRVVTLEQIVLQ